MVLVIMEVLYQRDLVVVEVAADLSADRPLIKDLDIKISFTEDLTIIQPLWLGNGDMICLSSMITVMMKVIGLDEFKRLQRKSRLQKRYIISTVIFPNSLFFSM